MEAKLVCESTNRVAGYVRRGQGIIIVTVCVAVNGARGSVVLPLDHGDGEGEVQDKIPVCGVTGYIGDGFCAVVDDREEDVKEELLVFLSQLPLPGSAASAVGSSRFLNSFPPAQRTREGWWLILRTL